jgi:hypothetical protein
MSNDPHFIIKKLHESDGNDPDAPIDPEAFRQHQNAKLLLAGPRERVEYLEQLSRSIGTEGTSLKSRAELLELYRENSKTHRQLLALKR